MLNPPFGYIDVPAQDDTVTAGSGGYGWALDDSGVKRVTIAADDGPPLPAQYGGAHPGPAKVYPQYPDAARAGFGFVIPPLAPGTHSLTVTILAKDGGKTTLAREIVVK